MIPNNHKLLLRDWLLTQHIISSTLRLCIYRKEDDMQVWLYRKGDKMIYAMEIQSYEQAELMNLLHGLNNGDL